MVSLEEWLEQIDRQAPDAITIMNMEDIDESSKNDDDSRSGTLQSGHE